MLPQLLWGLDTRTGAGRPVGSIHSCVHAVLVCQVGCPSAPNANDPRTHLFRLSIELIAWVHESLYSLQYH